MKNLLFFPKITNSPRRCAGKPLDVDQKHLLTRYNHAQFMHIITLVAKETNFKEQFQLGQVYQILYFLIDVNI